MRKVKQIPVTVYDRFRFALPAEGIVVGLSYRRDEGEGVYVRLTKSNSSLNPIGSNIWVHREQLRRREVSDVSLRPKD